MKIFLLLEGMKEILIRNVVLISIEMNMMTDNEDTTVDAPQTPGTTRRRDGRRKLLSLLLKVGISIEATQAEGLL